MTKNPKRTYNITALTTRPEAPEPVCQGRKRPHRNTGCQAFSAAHQHSAPFPCESRIRWLLEFHQPRYFPSRNGLLCFGPGGSWPSRHSAPESSLFAGTQSEDPRDHPSHSPPRSERGVRREIGFPRASTDLLADWRGGSPALHSRRKGDASLHAPGGSIRNSCQAGTQACHAKHHQQSSGAAKSLATRATKRLCLGPRGKRSAHSLRGRAHLGSHRRRQCQLEHYRPSGSDADGAAAPTRATRATSRPEDFP